jgi:hypothetical protein
MKQNRLSRVSSGPHGSVKSPSKIMCTPCPHKLPQRLDPCQLGLRATVFMPGRNGGRRLRGVDYCWIPFQGLAPSLVASENASTECCLAKFGETFVLDLKKTSSNFGFELVS